MGGDLKILFILCIFWSHCIFISSPKNKIMLKDSFIEEQTFFEFIKEAFSHKGYVLLLCGFFVCGFQITLVGTHIPGYMQDRVWLASDYNFSSSAYLI